MKLLTSYIVGILGLLITGYFVLAALGRPTDALLSFIIVVFGNASGIAALLYKQALSDKRTSVLVEDVKEIKEQTNGHMTALLAAKTQPEPDHEEVG